LAAILVVAAVVRLWCALGPMADRAVPIDAANERAVAQTWADGNGFSVTNDAGVHSPATDHVPVHVIVLTILDRFGLQSAGAQRVALGLLSLIGVAAVALIGWLLGRPTVGLVAAGIAAVDPMWFQPATNLMAEGIFLWMVPVVLLAAVWCRNRGTWVRIILLGLAVGLATLTRSEAILLLPAIAVPVAWLSTIGVRRKVLAVGATVLAFSFVVGPWLVRQHHDTRSWTLSTNQGSTFLGSSCDAAFNGPRAGGWVAQCFIDGLNKAYDPVANPHPARTGAEASQQLTTAAFDYDRAHESELPRVVALRVGRAWGVARVSDTYDYDVYEDRLAGPQWVGYAMNWLLIPLAIVGMVLLSRDEWRRWWILVPPIIASTIVVAIFWGTPRLRTGAEPSLALFAAFAIIEGGGRVLRRLRRRRSGGGDDEVIDLTDREVVPA
jgi:hypothetical protein